MGKSRFRKGEKWGKNKYANEMKKEKASDDAYYKEREELKAKVVELEKEYYQRLIDFLLEENEESIEDLFAFKIALFDTEKVKNATKATKSKIRKAKTALEAFKVIA